MKNKIDFLSRKNALKTLRELCDDSGKVYAIHYSCETFYDKATSPRITTIALRNTSSGQTKSFSIYSKSEVSKISGEEIENCYDDLEKDMLGDFYKFIKYNNSCFWLHWNMRNETYGFQAIEHRYKVLGGEPIEVPDCNKRDLSRMIKDIYGSSYIQGDPKFIKLIEKNNYSRKDVLTGAEEAQAFVNHKYLDLQHSTLKKVDYFCYILDEIKNKTLKTDAKWYHRLTSMKAFLEIIKENLIYSLLVIIGTVLSVFLPIKDILNKIYL